MEADRYAIENGILYHLFAQRRKNIDRVTPIIRQIVVPVSLRGKILQAFHDNNFGGAHQGQERMYANIRLRYYWKSCWNDTRAHCQSCHQCQISKRNTHARRAPLLPIECNNLFEAWNIDFLKVPEVNGYSRLLVAVERYSRWPEVFKTSCERAETACEILYSEVFARYGAPKIITSDRSKVFMAKLTKELCKKFSVKQHFTSSFHPASNGACERMNGAILNLLRAHPNSQTEWPSLRGYLPLSGLAFQRKGQDFHLSFCYIIARCCFPYKRSYVRPQQPALARSDV